MNRLAKILFLCFLLLLSRGSFSRAWASEEVQGGPSSLLDLGFVGNVQISPEGVAAFIEKFVNLQKDHLVDSLNTAIVERLLLQRDPIASFNALSFNINQLKFEGLVLGAISTENNGFKYKVKVPVEELDILGKLRIGIADARQINLQFNMTLNHQIENPVAYFDFSFELDIRKPANEAFRFVAEESQFSLPASSQLSLDFINLDNGMPLLASSDLFKQEVLNGLTQEIFNHLIPEALESQSELLGSALMDTIEGVSAVSIPAIDMTGQIDYYYIEQSQNKILELFENVERSCDLQRVAALSNYIQKYERYIVDHKIFIYFVMYFVEQFRHRLDSANCHLLGPLRETMSHINSMMHEFYKDSLQASFLKVKHLTDIELQKESPDYFASIYLDADQNLARNFVDLIEDGQLFSADEHKIIGHLLTASQLMKVSKRKLVENRRAKKVLHRIDRAIEDWELSITKMQFHATEHFERYVRSIFKSMERHYRFFESDSYANKLREQVESMRTLMDTTMAFHDRLKKNKYHVKILLPIDFINRYLKSLYEAGKFDRLDFGISDDDLIDSGQREILVSFKSPPAIIWDDVKSCFKLVVESIKSKVYFRFAKGVKIPIKQYLSVSFDFIPDQNQKGEFCFSFSKVAGKFEYIWQDDATVPEKLLSVWSLASFKGPIVRPIIEPLVYNQLDAILSQFATVVPDLSLTPTIVLHPQLCLVSYNRDNIMISAKVGRISENQQGEESE